MRWSAVRGILAMKTWTAIPIGQLADGISKRRKITKIKTMHSTDDELNHYVPDTLLSFSLFSSCTCATSSTSRDLTLVLSFPLNGF